MGFRLPPGPVDAYLHRVLEKVPKGAAALLAASLSPAVEALLNGALHRTLEALHKENGCRKAQSRYVLKNPRIEHFIEAGDSLASMLDKPYGIAGLLVVRGDFKGEEEVPDELGIEANPQGGME